jgi:hypothetical protein
MTPVFLTQIAATLAMAGITWFAQVVHYPLFHLVGSSSFQAYEISNMRLTTCVVGPLILAEGVTAVLLLWRRPEGISRSQVALGFGLLVVIWFSTSLLQVPAHEILAHGFDAIAHQRLVLSNWIRTGAWSVRALVVLWMVVGVMGQQRGSIGHSMGDRFRKTVGEASHRTPLDS